MNDIPFALIVVGIWIVVGVLLVVFVTAKTSHDAELNPLIHARGEPTASENMARAVRARAEFDEKYKRKRE